MDASVASSLDELIEYVDNEEAVGQRLQQQLEDPIKSDLENASRIRSDLEEIRSAMASIDVSDNEDDFDELIGDSRRAMEDSSSLDAGSQFTGEGRREAGGAGERWSGVSEMRGMRKFGKHFDRALDTDEERALYGEMGAYSGDDETRDLSLDLTADLNQLKSKLLCFAFCLRSLRICRSEQNFLEDSRRSSFSFS